MSDDSETGTGTLHRFRECTGRSALRNSSIAAMDAGKSAASGDRTGQGGIQIELAAFRVFFDRQAAATPEGTADREKGDSWACETDSFRPRLTLQSFRVLRNPPLRLDENFRTPYPMSSTPPIPIPATPKIHGSNAF